MPHKVCGSFCFIAVLCYSEEKLHNVLLFLKEHYKVLSMLGKCLEPSRSILLLAESLNDLIWYPVEYKAPSQTLARQSGYVRTWWCFWVRVLGITCYALITETSTVHDPSPLSKIILPSSPFMLRFTENFFPLQDILRHCYLTSHLSSYWGFISLIKHWSAIIFNYRSCY